MAVTVNVKGSLLSGSNFTLCSIQPLHCRKTLQCYSGRLAASSAGTPSIQKECPAFLQRVNTTVVQGNFDTGIEILYTNSLYDLVYCARKRLARQL